MTTAALAARCVALLGPLDGPIAVEPASGALARALARRVRVDGETPVAAVCTFVGERADPTARATRLAALASRLAAGAPLALVDHNRPRARWRRPAAWLALASRALPPSRATYPTAREAAACGFRVERLCLLAGERLQLVLARKATAEGS